MAENDIALQHLCYIGMWSRCRTLLSIACCRRISAAARFSQPEQLGMRHTHGMDRSIEFGVSKIEEFFELREPQRQILVLPDQGRQCGSGVRHVIRNLCGGEADACELGFKVVMFA